MYKPCSILSVSPIAFALLATTAVHAAPVSLTNASFESPVNTDPVNGAFASGEQQDFDGGVDFMSGWTTLTTENNGVGDGTQIAVGFKDIAPSAGDQVLSLMAGASTQQVTSLAWSGLSVGDQLTLTVAIGDRNAPPVWADESFFALTDGDTSGLLADGTLLASAVASSGALTTPFVGSPNGIDSGTMQDRSFTYTVVGADLTRNGNVGILLAGLGDFETAGNGFGSPTHQAFFDNVRLDYTAIGAPAADPKITSFTAVGGGVWELTISGDPSTNYEFRSSTTLEFTPGNLVSPLSQLDPGTDPGTVDVSGDFVTTDGSGVATVRLTLTGDPKDFIRGVSLP